ncbi:MAG: tetratricopeptide repeat protein, partial [Acidobacteria bacterium]|nr:tetratricopeptide repeat protein [Acidobacteriota bacterium]MCA1637806.1 tetratricopeptide repeat protein [Acidobacteriota bacterium]
KKVFINLIFVAFVLAQLNCTKLSTADNSNETSANIPAANNPIAEISQTNDTKPQETPLPTFTDANEALTEADKLFDVNKNEEAIDAYKQAVKLNPDLAEAYFKLGIAYALVESQEATTETTDETPSKTSVSSKKRKKDAPLIRTDSDKAFDNAVKAYKRILAKDPKDDVAQYNLGRSYNKLNQDQEAEKALREAVKLKPEDSEYQTEFGAILVKLAHYEEAVGALKKALKIDPNNSQAQELLEKAEAGRKRVDFGVNKLKQQKQQQLQQQQLQNKPE